MQIEEELNSGIYRLYWRNCEYFYIGQTENINKRKRKHEVDLINQRHDNSRLQNVYNKYGLPEFEIIEYVKINELDKAEQDFLDLFFKDKNCCNLSPSANSTRGYKHTKQQIENNRKARLGNGKGKLNHKSVSVINLKTGKRYECIRDAAKDSTYSYMSLARILRGERNNYTDFRYE